MGQKYKRQPIARAMPKKARATYQQEQSKIELAEETAGQLAFPTVPYSSFQDIL